MVKCGQVGDYVSDVRRGRCGILASGGLLLLTDIRTGPRSNVINLFIDACWCSYVDDIPLRCHGVSVFVPLPRAYALRGTLWIEGELVTGESKWCRVYWFVSVIQIFGLCGYGLVYTCFVACFSGI